jgi:long-subunit acyl-CoA synthetase (AMP-forming)
VPVGNDRPFISALIFVNALAAKELLTAKGVACPAGSAESVQTFLAGHDLVKEAIKAAIAEGNTRLEHWETVKKVEIIADEAIRGQRLAHRHPQDSHRRSDEALRRSRRSNLRQAGQVSRFREPTLSHVTETHI